MTHRVATRAVHAGREDLSDLGLHAVPLDLSTTYPCRDQRAEAARLDLVGLGERLEGPQIYGRVGNPTVNRFEDAVADLEGLPASVAFATGMAALTACLLASATAGKAHVVGIRPLYGTSDHLVGSGLLRTSVTWARPEDVGACVTGETGLVLLETPANPTLAEVDIAIVVRAAGDVPVVVDNTFATPVLQRPAGLGAALVLHSATKFFGGHGDVMGGVVACDDAWARRLRQVRTATGSVLHPFAGYLLLRGLQTLPVRVERASATAAVLAERLAGHPSVTTVHYPGLRAGRPEHQMIGGGAMLSFEADRPAEDVVAAVRLITPAVSLGSADTLIQHPGSLSHHIVEHGDRLEGGIADRLLRLSVGLEDPEDLWEDLDKALRA
jgi:methionine-gamma-lyase